MKTIRFPVPPFHTANNLLFGSLLLSLLGMMVFFYHLPAFADLCTALESQWLNFTGWMSGFMAQGHPAHW